MKCTEMHCQIVDVYDKYAILLPAISKQYRQSEIGCIDISDDYHPRLPATSINAEIVVVVEQVFRIINA